MTQILLIRHGQTDWNVVRRIMGGEPIALNEKGRKQVAGLRDFLSQSSIDVMYASPTKRTMETASIINEAFNLNIIEEPSLIEVGYGEFVGMTFEEVKQLPGYFPFNEFPDKAFAKQGESLLQVTARMRALFDRVVQEHAGKTVAFVTHCDTIKCLLFDLLKINYQKMIHFRIDNASVSVVEVKDSHPVVLSTNLNPDFKALFVSRKMF